MLRHVQERGDTTIYEWRKGVKPTTVERPHMEEVSEQQDEEAVRSQSGLKYHSLRAKGGS